VILGFAHLAVNVDNLTEAEAVWRVEGYARTALHLDVPNHPSKQKFLASYRPLHDLMLLAGPGLWPLELTRHGATYSDNTQLVWEREAIRVTVPDPAPLRRLFVEGLGFRVAGDDTLVLDSRLPGWSCRLRLQSGACIPVSLEAAGPTCLAFYCNRSAVDAQRLIDLGATDLAGGFDLTLGERAMTIAMLRAPGGPLLELINSRNKT
jgi:hypothetical protein